MCARPKTPPLLPLSSLPVPYNYRSIETATMSNPTELVNDGGSAEQQDASKKPAAAAEGITTMNGTKDTPHDAPNGLAPAINGDIALPKDNNDAAGAKVDGILEEEEEAEIEPDEEENLFITLEEQEKALAAALDQPKAVEAAPRLLQAALKEGQVKADESEEESDKEKEMSPVKVAAPEPHIHMRVSRVHS